MEVFWSQYFLKIYISSNWTNASVLCNTTLCNHNGTAELVLPGKLSRPTFPGFTKC